MPLVLLVEDEETLRKVLRSLLERDGFEVAEAADGAEALSAVDRLTPDAVVLDLNLPVLDGFAVLSRLRTRSTSATLPVLVLTANGDEASEVRALKMGANEFLTKPVRPRALSARLKLLLAVPE
jgi:DNA-binding response OmpR family regulator